MRAYRITSPRHAATALSGEGARLYGGRWNSPGRRCVYAAESRALAILELLVHLTGRSRGLPWVILTLEIPDDAIDRIARPPEAWNAMPAGATSQRIGDNWLASRRSLALAVPSVMVPEEWNVLLDPDAADFGGVQIVETREFRLDLRLDPVGSRT